MEQSASETKVLLTHMTTWMNLEDTRLSETSWSQGDKYCMIPPDVGSTEVKFIETESRVVAAGGWGEGKVQVLSTGYRASVPVCEEDVPKLPGGDGCTTT